MSPDSPGESDGRGRNVMHCSIDEDGFCDRHGWDCADFWLFLDEK